MFRRSSAENARPIRAAKTEKEDTVLFGNILRHQRIYVIVLLLSIKPIDVIHVLLYIFITLTLSPVAAMTI